MLGSQPNRTYPMAAADRHAPVRFLRTLFEPTDWVAIFLKSYERSAVAQRVGPVSWVQSERFQRWLRAMNARRYNVFVSVNAIAAGRRSRTRDAIGAVRHVFLDADHDGPAVLSRVEARRDLPSPSYVLHSSPNRVHVFWRVTGFDPRPGRAVAEAACARAADGSRSDAGDPEHAAAGVLQSQARPAAPRDDRVPERRAVCTGRQNFPPIEDADSMASIRASARSLRTSMLPVIERAKRYLASVPPAIAGQHGDVHTFRVCCRLTRGFALDDDQALHVLSEWNARCEPPWSPAELLDKLRRAARYGREPVGGLL